MKHMSHKAEERKNITTIAMNLAQLIKEEPSLLESELVQKGNELIGIYEDTNFTNKFQDIRSKKIEIISMAIEDISMGVMTLRSSSLGLVFKNGKIHTYVEPHGTQPEGTVIFSINWKNIKAFLNWREDEPMDVAQSEIESSIYKLTIMIAALI